MELVCENHMVIHIIPEEEDFDKVYHSLKYPNKYLSLGRYEDLLDVESVDIVNIFKRKKVATKRNIYIPVETQTLEGVKIIGNENTTIFNLTKEYEITKQGLRRWKRENGRIKAYYISDKKILTEAYVDDVEQDAAIVFS